MGKPGPKPKPTSQKIAEGNPGKRALNKAEPKPNARNHAPLPVVEGDPVALAEWNRLAPEMFKAGLLTEIDKAPLALYCCAYARWVEAHKMINRFGAVVKGKGDKPVLAPFTREANSAARLMMQAAAEFGMTPSARTRIQSAPPAEADESPWGGIDSMPSLADIKAGNVDLEALEADGEA